MEAARAVSTGMPEGRARSLVRAAAAVAALVGVTLLAAPPAAAGRGDLPPGTPAVSRVPALPRTDLVDTIGVVSYNSYHDLRRAQVRRDLRKLTARRGVDLIGFQEGEDFGDLYRRLDRRGFTAVVPRGAARQNPVAFRTSVFELVSHTGHRAHRSSRGRPNVRHVFPSRWTVEVVLRHRRSGHILTLLNSHVNHKTEDFARGRPGRVLPGGNASTARRHLRMLRGLWNTRSTTWTVGTADLNFDHAADRRWRVRGMPVRAFRGKAVSNWQALGLTQPPTHVPVPRHLRRYRRWIDHILVPQRHVRRHVRFVRHRVLRGFASDHRPLFARLALHAPPRPEPAATVQAPPPAASALALSSLTIASGSSAE